MLSAMDRARPGSSSHVWFLLSAALSLSACTALLGIQTLEDGGVDATVNDAPIVDSARDATKEAARDATLVMDRSDEETSHDAPTKNPIMPCGPTGTCNVDEGGICCGPPPGAPSAEMDSSDAYSCVNANKHCMDASAFHCATAAQCVGTKNSDAETPYCCISGSLSNPRGSLCKAVRNCLPSEQLCDEEAGQGCDGSVCQELFDGFLWCH
jgi:hypothetical protein